MVPHGAKRSFHFARERVFVANCGMGNKWPCALSQARNQAINPLQK
jgi:hypothetical protein